MGTTNERDIPEEILKRQEKEQRVQKITTTLGDAVEAVSAPKLFLVVSLAFLAHLVQIGLGELVGAFLVVHGSRLLPLRIDVKS